jgi:hypothetical protein
MVIEIYANFVRNCALKSRIKSNKQPPDQIIKSLTFDNFRVLFHGNVRDVSKEIK